MQKFKNINVVMTDTAMKSLSTLDTTSPVFTFNSVDYDTGGNAVTVSVADFNNDGVPDVVTSHIRSDNSLSVLLGKGDGTLAPHVDYEVGKNPESVSVADVNNDTILDLITANLDDNSVSVLLGNGDGTFNPKIDYIAGYGTFTVSVGDMNNDNNADLVIASYGNSTVSILLGNGDGTFKPKIVTNAESPEPFATVGDINNDGNLDVITSGGGSNLGTTSGHVKVFLGNGKGSLNRPTSYVTNQYQAGKTLIEDLNNDGNLDIVTKNTNGGDTVSVLLSTGNNGTFQSHVDYHISGNTVSLADMNYDGRLDLVTPVSVLLGEGDGTFKPEINFDTNNIYNTYAYALSVADMNNDGKLDLVSAWGGFSVTVSSAEIPTLSIANPNVSSKEGNSGSSNITLTVNLSAASTEIVSVNYATQDGTATADSDYVGGMDTLIFAPGETSKTISVPILGDTDVESDETLQVLLSSPGNATLGEKSSATLTLLNDDALPILSIATPSVSVKEGDSGSSDATLTVNLSAASTQTVTVNYATQDGTATADSDYVADTDTLIFAPGEISKTISVPILGDTGVETNETLQVLLSSPNNAKLGVASKATLTLLNDDALPVLSIATPSISVKEGDSGSSDATLTVNLSTASTQTITVNYATQNGTATANSDYVAGTGTLSFAPGETSKTISVPILGDTGVEGDETLQVLLSSPSHATLGTVAKATLTLLNDDAAPVVSIATPNVSIKEGNSGTSNATLTVNLSAVSTQIVTVNYASQNGTATAGSDYIARTGTLSFAPGETSKTITVPILGDTSVESDETLQVQLSSPSNATLNTTTSATLTLSNDDAVPILSIANSIVSVKEGNSGSSNAMLTVNLSAASTQIVTVNYSSQDGTATAGNDYIAGNGTLSFAPGETSKTLNVPIIGDTSVESDETLQVLLSSPSNATLGTASKTTLTLNNDDAAIPVLSIANPNVSIKEGNSGSSNALLTVNLSAASTQMITVNYASQDGTATAGSDYIARTGTLSFVPGETSKIISIPVIGDTSVESDETLQVLLSSPSNAMLGAVSGATLTLSDDDNLAINNLPIGSVTIMGLAIQGKTLIATNTLTDADGLGPITYQWQANNTNIGTGNSYTLTPNEIGKTITVIANYTDGLGKAESVNSTATAAVTNPPVTETAGITITGTDLTTNEQGDTALFNVKLNSAPTRDVTLTFASSDTTEGIITNPTLKFTSANWSTAQTFTVTGQNDSLVDGNIAYSINAKITTLDIFYKNVAVDTLTLSNQDTPVAKVETITGTNSMDVLQGTSAPSYLLGEAADDDLSGGAGNDTIYGSYGNDLLFGEDDNDVLYGEQDADYMDGGAGNDILDGGLGLDTLIGGAGNDIYYLGYDAVDVIDDQGLTNDIDTVIMPYQLSKYTLPTGIEQGTIATGTGAGSLTGNTGNNTLTGNDGKNTLIGAVGRDSLFGGLGDDALNGGTGDDVLEGGTGKDNLTGGAGQDTFLFNTALKANVDKITDYNSTDDTIQLENAIFSKLATTGVLDASLFAKTAAHDANDYIIYNSITGAVSYDADGNGAGSAVQIAVLGVNLPLSYADFVVI